MSEGWTCSSTRLAVNDKKDEQRCRDSDNGKRERERESELTQRERRAREVQKRTSRRAVRNMNAKRCNVMQPTTDETGTEGRKE